MRKGVWNLVFVWIAFVIGVLCAIGGVDVFRRYYPYCVGVVAALATLAANITGGRE